MAGANDKFEDGVLVERVRDTTEGGEPTRHASATGRPNDLKEGEVHNSTLAGRRKAREASLKAETPERAENKAVASAESKARKRAENK